MRGHFVQTDVLENHVGRQAFLRADFFAEVREHAAEFGVQGTAAVAAGLGQRVAGIHVTEIALVGEHQRTGRGNEIVAFVRQMQDAVLLDLFGEVVEHDRLAHDALPKFDVLLLSTSPEGAVHRPVILHLAVFRRRQQGGVKAHSVLVLVLEHGAQQQMHLLLTVDQGGRILAVVTVHGARAIHLVKFFSEVVQQKLAAACCRLGIRHDFLKELHAHLLFSDGFALEELLQLVNVLVAVEGDATPFATITTCAACFLIVALQGLGHVVVNDEANVRLVDAHAEGNGCHNDVHVLHQELVLDFAALTAVHARVIGQRLHAIDAERVRNLLHLFSAEAVDDAALAYVLKAVTHDLLQRILLGPDLIKEVVPVEGRFEHNRVHHAQVLLNVLLHLGGGRGGQRHDGHIGNALDNGLDAAVLWPEIVTPFRNAVGFIHGHETDADRFQKLNGLGFGQALRRDVQKLGPPFGHVHFHALGFSTAQRGVQKVGNAFVLVVPSDGIHLVLHQRDQGTDDQGHTVHHQCRELIAHGLASPRGHDHKRVTSLKDTEDGFFLLTLEFVESEKCFQRLLGRQLNQAHWKAVTLLD